MPAADHSAKISRLETQEKESYRCDDAILGRRERVESKMRAASRNTGRDSLAADPVGDCLRGPTVSSPWSTLESMPLASGHLDLSTAPR